MAKPSSDSDKSESPAQTQIASDFAKSLSDEHRMLVILKKELYEGSWESMLDDLRNRLAGKPYIFKLVNRIQDDIERIEQMQRFEEEHSIDQARKRAEKTGHPKCTRAT